MFNALILDGWSTKFHIKFLINFNIEKDIHAEV